MSLFGDNPPIFAWDEPAALRHCYQQDSDPIFFWTEPIEVEWIGGAPVAAPKSTASDPMVMEDRNDRSSLPPKIPELLHTTHLRPASSLPYLPSWEPMQTKTLSPTPPVEPEIISNPPFEEAKISYPVPKAAGRLSNKRRSWADYGDDFDDFDGDYSEGEEEADMSCENSSEDEAASSGEHLQLGASKSPVMEALVYCALKGWGLHLVKCQGSEITFKVDDFEAYCKKSQQICSKQHPTSDRQARIKALKRWFPDFPMNRRDVPQPNEFYISIAKDKDKLMKIKKIIEKNRHLVGMKKVRRVA